MANRFLFALSARLRRTPVVLWGGVAGAFIMGGAITAHSISADLEIVDEVEGAAVEEHMVQADLNATPAADRFKVAFAHGNELFQTTFNAVDGIGAKVHAGERFTRTPRADQKDTGE